jgi:hypothetical protein
VYAVESILATLMGISLMAGSAFAKDYAFNFSDKVKIREEPAGLTKTVLVEEPTYSVGAVVVKNAGVGNLKIPPARRDYRVG